MFEELTEAVRRPPAHDGLVVILDDIHRATSRRCSSCAIWPTRSPTRRLSSLATFRDVEPASALPRVLPDLLRSPVGRAPRSARLRPRRGARTAAGRDSGRATATPRRPRGHRRQSAVRPRGRPGDGRRDLAAGPAAAQRARRRRRPARPGLRRTAGGWCRRRPSSGGTSRWPSSPPRSTSRSATACRRSTRRSRTAWWTGSATRRVPVRPRADPGRGRGVLHRPPTGPRCIVPSPRRSRRSTPTICPSIWPTSPATGPSWRRTARPRPPARWTIRAADDAVRRLAYEEGVRLYRAALASTRPLPTANVAGSRSRSAGPPTWPATCTGASEAAVAAAESPVRRQSRAAGRGGTRPRGGPRSRRSTPCAKRLCEEALAGSGDHGDTRAAGPAAGPAQPPRVLRRRAGPARGVERGGARPGPRRAATTARWSSALRARQEACPGPAGRDERLLLATEMLDAGPADGQRPHARCGASCGGSTR